MENIFEIIIDNFCNLNELVNSLLINYITLKILILKNIPHKFILGFYNESSQDIENNYSYKHTWIENNNTIYDLSNYILGDFTYGEDKQKDEEIQKCTVITGAIKSNNSN